MEGCYEKEKREDFFLEWEQDVEGSDRNVALSMSESVEVDSS